MCSPLITLKADFGTVDNQTVHRGVYRPVHLPVFGWIPTTVQRNCENDSGLAVSDLVRTRKTDDSWSCDPVANAQAPSHAASCPTTRPSQRAVRACYLSEQQSMSAEARWTEPLKQPGDTVADCKIPGQEPQFAVAPPMRKDIVHLHTTRDADTHPRVAQSGTTVGTNSQAEFAAPSEETR
ncbi:hypothetical protein [uncultured Sulfitobacter sp.]|uniref:hypothetical protein n=1 Tax=uncultured Sulfitobacter sp. TaxID=191468 RepID=UPI0026250BF9|nr:hypothetical protein [uncultured Sulfitobacter sp.]